MATTHIGSIYGCSPEGGGLLR